MHKLLVITLPPKWGGGGFTQTIGLCKYLRQRGGFEIRVAYPDAGDSNGGTQEFIQRSRRGLVHEVEGFSYQPIRPAFPAIEFKRYAPNQVWDDLLRWADSCQVMGGGIAQGFPAARSKTPYALWVASTREADGAESYRASGFLRRRWLDLQYHFIRKQERETLHNAARVFVISEYTRRLLERTYNLKIDPCDFIPVPVDADVFTLDETVNKQLNTISYVGRVNDPRKQVPLLLAALRSVREKGIDVFLKLGGEEPGPRLKELVQKLGLGQCVEFVGYIPLSDLPRFYQSSLFSVLPSQEEGQGIVVLEAMACGLPVIATRCGGPESLIEDGRDGFLVANGSEEELAEKIEFLIKQPNVALRMGRYARQSVIQNFTPPKTYSKIVNFHLALGALGRDFEIPWSGRCQAQSLR